LLGSALVRFGSYIPSGDPDENREYVNRLMTEHPLQFLATRITIGPESSLLRSIQGEAEQAEQAITDLRERPDWGQQFRFRDEVLATLERVGKETEDEMGPDEDG
jgi:hypothetical protein